MSYQKVLTFHCYKPDFAWVGRDIGKTFACFKCDEFGLLDKDLTLACNCPSLTESNMFCSLTQPSPMNHATSSSDY